MAITATATARFSNLVKKMQWPEFNFNTEVGTVEAAVAPVLGTVLEYDEANTKWIAATATATKVAVFLERPVSVDAVNTKALILVRGDAIVSKSALVFTAGMSEANKATLIAKLADVRILANTTV